MGTPFSEIYELFLSQIKIHDIANVFLRLSNAQESGDQEEIRIAEQAVQSLLDNMEYWLMSSIGHFGSCRKDIRSPDLDMESFSDTLDIEEKNILAKYMVYAYLLTHVVTETNLKQSLNSKDYRMYSPAGQLKALRELRDSVYDEANSLKSQYSYNIHSLKEFFK